LGDFSVFLRRETDHKIGDIFVSDSKIVSYAELFNIPDWDCPDTVKAPFYEGLERNEHSMSPILWLGVVFGMASLGLCYWNAHSLPHSKNW